MNIDIYCVGRSRGEGLAIVGGCGVVMVAVDESKRTHKREFSYWLGGSDQLLCEFQAARLGLAAVIPANRGDKVTLHVTSPVVADYLLSGSNDGETKPMKEAVRWYGYYKNIQVVVHSDVNGGYMEYADRLAKSGLETQKEFDSLTVIDD